MENLNKSEIADNMRDTERAKRLDESNVEFINAYGNHFRANLAFEQAQVKAQDAANAWKAFIDKREALFREIAGVAPAGEWIAESEPVEVQVVSPDNLSEPDLGEMEN